MQASSKASCDTPQKDGDMRHFLFVRSEVDDAELTSLQFRVLAHFARRADGNGVIYSSNENIAKVCVLNVSTVKKAIRELTDLNIIVSELRPGRPTLRRINTPEKWKKYAGEKTTWVKFLPRSKNSPEMGEKSHQGAGENFTHKGSPKKGILEKGIQSGVSPKIPVSVPQALNTPEFIKAFGEWVAYLKQRRLSPSVDIQRRHMAKLESYGLEGALQAIPYSIERQYRAPFMPPADKGPANRLQRPMAGPAKPVTEENFFDLKTTINRGNRN